MEKTNIKDANVSTIIRDMLPLATKENKGLLSAQFADILEKRYVPIVPTVLSFDLDLLYKERDTGLSILIITSEFSNSPGTGILLHMQRTSRGNMSSSQFVSQLLFNMNGKVLYRSGSFATSSPTYSAWKEL